MAEVTAKVISVIMAVITALYMLVSCGKLPGKGGNETTTTVSQVTESEPAGNSGSTQPGPSSPEETGTVKEEPPVSKTLTLEIGGRKMPVTWENNDSVNALAHLADGGLTVNMSMYGGFEQVGPLGTSLPANDRQTSTSYGDIVLYQGNQIVIFYGSNSWSYTRLGHINLSQSEMTGLLSGGDVTITLSYE